MQPVVEGRKFFENRITAMLLALVLLAGGTMLLTAQKEEVKENRYVAAAEKWFAAHPTGSIADAETRHRGHVLRLSVD